MAEPELAGQSLRHDSRKLRSRDVEHFPPCLLYSEQKGAGEPAHFDLATRTGRTYQTAGCRLEGTVGACIAKRTCCIRPGRSKSAQLLPQIAYSR